MKALIILMMSGMMMFFQNCQRMALTSSDSEGLLKAGVLAPVNSNGSEDAQGDIPQPGETPPGGGTPELPVVDTSGDTGEYVCILNGPGKSIKLGLTAGGAPAGQHKIKAVLCMTENACLNIASQAFEVQGAYFRGYCKLPHGNPHVIHITEGQLQEKVNKILAQ